MKTRSPSPLSVLALVLTLLLAPACGDNTPVEGPDDSWGAAVGGLALALELPHPHYGECETIVATIRARNEGSTPLILPAFEDGMWYYRVHFENKGDGPDYIAGSGLFLDFETRPDATLAPGAEWTKQPNLVDEKRRYLRIIENRKPGDDWDYLPCLPPGHYRAWIEFSSKGAAGEGIWTGSVRSNVVDVQIVALVMRGE